MENTAHVVDIALLLCAVAVFGLPLALLIPNFSVWDVVPKVKVHRFHILSQHLDWRQLNTIIIAFTFIFFCLCLEFRKRILDGMIEEVYTVKNATVLAMEANKEHQEATIRACVQLLDASKDHYESLVILEDELRKRNKNPEHSLTLDPNFAKKVK